jgi:hypothetical protein
MNEIGKRLLKTLLQDLRYGLDRARRVVGQNREYTLGYERVISEAEEQASKMELMHNHEDYTLFVAKLKQTRDDLYREQPHKGYGASQAVLDIFSRLGEPI